MYDRNTAKARWMARVSVSLNTRMPRLNGSGEAIQSWNTDQASATASSIRLIQGPGERPPVSLSATSWLTSTSGAVGVFMRTCVLW
ncbi:hypothetical protein D9M68_887020 [compost metagenome]